MKYCIILLAAIITLVSCNEKNKTNHMVSENEKLVQQYFEHFNNHDWEKLAAMYTETAAFKDPSLGKGIVKQTRLQVVNKYSELAQMFPDVKDKVIQTYPSGSNHIIVEFVSTGTAPDNTKFELPICTIFTIENGKISKDFSYFDNF
ncbi:nuclear transport factor 2 family protein [Filimonas effusa]|uniref:Nuclear transport factor 2 family protein n=1 Tax=Filimonas effusa TaxID=2508721 RepID=A0A4Q1D1H2_9BACT|nr:nuclear transport factor 2 family protein [Filimonas effusa]RXK81708.1 nuclear transport factor 2 family protein [Filimonas effusa]